MIFQSIQRPTPEGCKIFLNPSVSFSCSSLSLISSKSQIILGQFYSKVVPSVVISKALLSSSQQEQEILK